MGKLKRLASAAGLSLGLAAAVYFSPEAARVGLMKWQQHRMAESPKIGTEADLINYVNAQAKILSSDNSRVIVPIWQEERNIALSYKQHENIYIIEIGGTGKNTYVVDHEIYHILAGHCDRNPYSVHFLEKMRYFFWDELKVTIYQEVGKRF